MADVQPLRALHYNLATVGPLEDLIAPPYDVIDADYRRDLAGRNAHNVVGIDLPEGGDPYAHAAELLEDWVGRGVVVRDDQPALWAIEQSFVGPDGSQRVRKGFFCSVRLVDYGPGKVRPHERTHPAAKQDRLNLMRTTRANLSPIFSLFPDDGEVWSALEPATIDDVWCEATDDEGTVNRVWRIADPAIIERVERLMTDRELLIADGHHRYETARTYADEIGGEGDHNYVMMCLVSMSDPGLAVFPTHRLVGDVSEQHREKLGELIDRDFTLTEVDTHNAAPDSGNELPTFGFVDHASGRAAHIALSSPKAADDALAGHSESYRRLDTAVLEKLVLEGALGLTEEDISHQNGLAYARNIEQALMLMDTGDYELAFLMRPTPIEQVRAIAEAGETMPPKSTYFFPKLPSGLLFNPLR